MSLTLRGTGFGISVGSGGGGVGGNHVVAYEFKTSGASDVYLFDIGAGSWSVLHSFAVPIVAMGVDHTNEYLWFCNQSSNCNIYQLDFQGNVLNTYNSTGLYSARHFCIAIDEAGERMFFTSGNALDNRVIPYASMGGTGSQYGTRDACGGVAFAPTSGNIFFYDAYLGNQIWRVTSAEAETDLEVGANQIQGSGNLVAADALGRIYYISSGGDVSYAAEDGSGETDISGSINGARLGWDDDAQKLYTTDGDGLWRYDPDGSNEEVLLASGGPGVYQPTPITI